MEQTVDDRLLRELPLYTLLALPIELLVYVLSFVTSARDRVKLRYVSRQVRVAVETPSLWRDFTWMYFDFSEESSIESAFKTCGGHVKRLSFPDLMIPVQSLLQHCSSLVQLSLPSAKLSLNQLRTIMQSMKELQYLDILWASRNDIKHLLWIVGYPVYGFTIEELTIREQVKDSSLQEALHYLLNEWTAFNLIPHKINIVVISSYRKVGAMFRKWIPLRSQSGDHTGHGLLKVYDNNFSISSGLSDAVFPLYQFQFTGHCFKELIVATRNHGLLGLDRDLVFTDHVADGSVLNKARMMKSSGNVQDGPLNSGIIDIGFLTHFSACRCNVFYSGHLEQLAVVCPNLQQLNLLGNVNCLKSLQGLRAIATYCQKLEGLNITEISVKQVENCVKLWEILVDLHLTNLGIELCCLLCFGKDYQSKQSVISLHQKCLKMKALEAYSYKKCTKCVKNKQPLLLSNFPVLIRCITRYIDLINICEKLRYLWYVGNNISIWPIVNCNLQELCVSSDLVLPDSFMNTISTHGGLLHVVFIVHFVTQSGIATLIENSPNLITCQVRIQPDAAVDPRDFRATLEKKYSHRKLFLHGSYCLVKGSIPQWQLFHLYALHNMHFFSLWDQYD